MLVDQPLFESRRQWKPYFEALAEVMRCPNDIVLPISIFGDAHRISSTFRDINHVPVADPETLAKDEKVFQAILTVILRSMVEQSPGSSSSTQAQDIKGVLPSVFFCHCKDDGDALARDLRWYLYEHTQLAAFFDMHDIPHGSGVRNAIKSAISKSCKLVVCRLDGQTTREQMVSVRDPRSP